MGINRVTAGSAALGDVQRAGDAPAAWSCGARGVAGAGWRPISTRSLKLQHKPVPAGAALCVTRVSTCHHALARCCSPLVFICMPGILAFSSAAINEPFA